ncbi:MAG: tetratricopeptide repeat protein [Candidatus Acidoferrales bacterium]
MALVLAALAALPLHGQGPTLVAFTGNVYDEQGQPLAGATVVFQGLDITSIRREIRTDEKGGFYYGGFLPGRYRITILRGEEVLWSMPVTLPYFLDVLRLDINLKQLREAAESLRRLDPELEQRREENRRRRQRETELQRHYTRGTRYLEDGEAEQAIEEFQAAQALEPENGSAYAMLAAARAAAGQPQQAIALYQRALALEPNEAAHYNNLGTLLVEGGQMEEGLAHFDRAAQLDPGRASTYRFNRGAALLNAGRPAQALPALQEAVRRDPTLAVAHYFLGLALLRTSPRVTTEAEQERVEPRRGTLEAFRRYLQLAPDGEYAQQARNHLERFGALPVELHSPAEVPE